MSSLHEIVDDMAIAQPAEEEVEGVPAPSSQRCELCNASSVDTDWAKKSSKSGRALGGMCKHCGLILQSFPALTWQTLIAKSMTDPTFKKELDRWRAVIKGEASKDFKCQEVSRDIDIVVRMERSHVFYSAAEYEKKFQAKLNATDTVQILNEDGIWEKGALVATEEPRRVILSSATSLSLSTQVFAPARQFRSGQGTDAHEYLTNETTTAQKDFRSGILTEAKVREMLAARQSEPDGTATAAKEEVPEEDVESSENEVDQLGSGLLGGESPDRAKAKGKGKGKSKKNGKSKRGRGASAGRSVQPLPKTLRTTTHETSGTSIAKTSQPSAIMPTNLDDVFDQGDDGSSGVSGHRATDTSRSPATRSAAPSAETAGSRRLRPSPHSKLNENVARYMEILDPAQVAAGASLGKEIFQATRTQAALAKTAPQCIELVRLQERLELVRSAEQIAPKNVWGLNGETRKKLLADVCGRLPDILPEVRVTLCISCVRDAPLPDGAGIEAWLYCVMPVLERDAVFDHARPRCIGLEETEAAKVFVKLTVHETMIPGIAAGRVQELHQLMVAFSQAVNDRLTAGGIEFKERWPSLAFAMQDVCSIAEAVAEVTEPSGTEQGRQRVSTMTSSRTSNATLVHAAMKQNPTFLHALNEYTKASLAAETLLPEMTAATADAAAADGPALAKLVSRHAAWRDALPAGLTEPFEAAIKDRVEELQKTLKQNDVEGWEGLLRTCIVAANFAVVKRQGGLADVTPSVEKARRESTKEAYSEACKSVVKALAKDEIVPETVVGEWKAALNNVAARNVKGQVHVASVATSMKDHLERAGKEKKLSTERLANMEMLTELRSCLLAFADTPDGCEKDLQVIARIIAFKRAACIDDYKASIGTAMAQKLFTCDQEYKNGFNGKASKETLETFEPLLATCREAVAKLIAAVKSSVNDLLKDKIAAVESALERPWRKAEAATEPLSELQKLAAGYLAGDGPRVLSSGMKALSKDITEAQRMLEMASLKELPSMTSAKTTAVRGAATLAELVFLSLFKDKMPAHERKDKIRINFERIASQSKLFNAQVQAQMPKCIIDYAHDLQLQ